MHFCLQSYCKVYNDIAGIFYLCWNRLLLKIFVLILLGSVAGVVVPLVIVTAVELISVVLTLVAVVLIAAIVIAAVVVVVGVEEVVL